MAKARNEPAKMITSIRFMVAPDLLMCLLWISKRKELSGGQFESRQYWEAVLLPQCARSFSR
jgi:hypothetical protein